MHITGEVPNYWVFRIIRQYLYWPKILQVIFCYCSYNWAVQIIRGVFHSDISFIRLFMFMRALLCVSWCLYSWRRWLSRRWGMKPQQMMYMHTLRPLWTCLCDLLYWWHFFLIKAKLQVLWLLSWSARLSGFLNDLLD